MDERQVKGAVERLLEDPSLTAELVDPAARLLLKWGREQAEAIAREAAAEEIGQRLTALRQTMRRFARLAGNVPADLQPQQVETILAVLEEVMRDGLP